MKTEWSTFRLSECIGKKSMKQLHQIPGLERAHFEVRRGTAGQAIAYATKEDTRGRALVFRGAEGAG